MPAGELPPLRYFAMHKKRFAHHRRPCVVEPVTLSIASKPEQSYHWQTQTLLAYRASSLSLLVCDVVGIARSPACGAHSSNARNLRGDREIHSSRLQTSMVSRISSVQYLQLICSPA